MARIVRENKSTVDSRKRRQKSSREEPASEGARYTKTGAGCYAAKSNTAAEFSGCLVMFKKTCSKAIVGGNNKSTSVATHAGCLFLLSAGHQRPTPSMRRPIRVKAMRLRAIRAKVCLIACAVVASFSSRMTLPDSSRTQWNDQLSPRSKPMVSWCSLKILLLFLCIMLLFCMAGLLFFVP